jgi:hypothetical protein
MSNPFSMSQLPSFQEIEQGMGPSGKPSCPLNPERFMIDESAIDRDYSYMKTICPSVVSQISDWIEDACDRLEYDGSFLYDEYPDKTTILKMSDRITEQFPADTTIPLRDFIQALLCDEIFYRRARHMRKKKYLTGQN